MWMDAEAGRRRSAAVPSPQPPLARRARGARAASPRPDRRAPGVGASFVAPEAARPADAGSAAGSRGPLAEVSSGDERREEARRFARLLVSEIKLYNERAVLEGREHGNLYERLRDDIDRSRQMYEERIPQDVRSDNQLLLRGAGARSSPMAGPRPSDSDRAPGACSGAPVAFP